MALLEDRMSAPAEAPRDTARRTLAMRIAHRNRLRAERLARLRAEAGVTDTGVTDTSATDTGAPGTGAPEAGPAAPGVDAAATPPLSAVAPPTEPDAEAGAALEDFLRALTGTDTDTAPPAAEPGPGAVLQFQRPRPAARPEPAALKGTAPEGDLDRLPGMGPGLAWACARAGLGRCADLAALDAEDLAQRLGPLGRLIPAASWIAAARAIAGPEA